MSADGLARFNALPLTEARDRLLACCGSPTWAERMAAGRPYSSARDAARQSSAIVAMLTVADLRAALGGDGRYGLPQGDELTDGALAESVQEYQRRFGHSYVVFIPGRTAVQHLALLQTRLRNAADSEWHVVRAELQKINAACLQQLLAGSP